MAPTELPAMAVGRTPISSSIFEHRDMRNATGAAAAERKRERFGHGERACSRATARQPMSRRQKPSGQRIRSTAA